MCIVLAAGGRGGILGPPRETHARRSLPVGRETREILHISGSPVHPLLRSRWRCKYGAGGARMGIICLISEAEKIQQRCCCAASSAIYHHSPKQEVQAVT